MEGVILYADDHIYTPNRAESVLFDTLREKLPVLGVHNLELASSAVKSIGSFKALILDWQYGNSEEDNDVFAEAAAEVGVKKLISNTSQKEDAAFKFLLENDFYSLIYIFSEIDIEENYGVRLREKFGDRVRIRKKGVNFTKENVSDIKDEILKEIEEWKEQNQNLSVPIQWSIAINESIQKIFKELAEADANWLKELYDSAQNDGVDPELFVIELMQLILSESVIQNNSLISSIIQIGSANSKEISNESLDAYRKSLSKLFSRLFYSELKKDTPIMTGDICRLADNEFGVLITPECDIHFIKNDPLAEFEFLTFAKEDMDEYLKKENSYDRNSTDSFHNFKEKRKESLRKMFNQEMGRFHLLPSLPLIKESLSESSVINFRTSTRRIKSPEVTGFERKYKINSPFIQQLRQRYLAYVGRVGTPALPLHVRDWNLQ